MLFTPLLFEDYAENLTSENCDENLFSEEYLNSSGNYAKNLTSENCDRNLFNEEYTRTFSSEDVPGIWFINQRNRACTVSRCLSVVFERQLS